MNRQIYANATCLASIKRFIDAKQVAFAYICLFISE